MEVYEQGGGLAPTVFRSCPKNLSRLMCLRRVTLIAVILLCDMLEVI